MVLVGEVDGWSEQAAASYIASAIDKPVVAYLAGRYAPKGPSLGHAGILISSRAAAQKAFGVTPPNKMAAFEEAGIPVAARPSEVPKLLKKLLKKKIDCFGVLTLWRYGIGVRRGAGFVSKLSAECHNCGLNPPLRRIYDFFTTVL